MFARGSKEGLVETRLRLSHTLDEEKRNDVSRRGSLAGHAAQHRSDADDEEPECLHGDSYVTASGDGKPLLSRDYTVKRVGDWWALAFGMVMVAAINGSGDTTTPVWSKIFLVLLSFRGI